MINLLAPRLANVFRAVVAVLRHPDDCPEEMRLALADEIEKVQLELEGLI